MPRPRKPDSPLKRFNSSLEVIRLVILMCDYANVRRELAKPIGLGRKPGQKRGRQKKV